ncbi:hypothetical protein [Radiobacillus deserti]|uniref:ABM domain-containing protein n=1 Tax=Radiobacillus deserti TaxID=2594883 RepID=A0A516KLG1_9BACI|nr:hypothetical protein [Radiobacillus deserti]QDP42229.1 hypothetical protein FN924_15830 [Radiobacillus deserti]
MFVKKYEYHIKEDQIEKFLDIQEKAGEIYSQYFHFQTMYLQHKHDSTKWMEITRYNSEVEYKKCMEMMKGNKELKELYESFQHLLLNQNEMIEEEFTEVKEIIK